MEKDEIFPYGICLLDSFNKGNLTKAEKSCKENPKLALVTLEIPAHLFWVYNELTMN